MNTTAATLTRPEPVAVDDNLDHLVCCDDNLATCGTDVTDVTWVDSPTTCPTCAYIDEHDLPCPVPGCPYRVAP